MIRLRFPVEHAGSVQVVESVDVAVTEDPSVVAAEGEKNGADEFAIVERTVRPWYTRYWADGVRPFTMISVETAAGCNETCAFCPVSRAFDPRPAGRLPGDLLDKIVDELADLNFSGRVALFGNNEPLLDDRIVDIVAIFRTRLPDADIRMLSNGTRATPDLAVALFEAGLSTLIINNYSDGRRLIRPVRRLIEQAARFRPFDVRVSVRNRYEVLTTRAGLAPNKARPARPLRGFCALPFTELHVAYTGNVSLCCFDATGRESMGHVGSDTLREIWAGPALEAYRRRLLAAERGGICAGCDFDGFRDPSLRRSRHEVDNNGLDGEGA